MPNWLVGTKSDAPGKSGGCVRLKVARCFCLLYICLRLCFYMLGINRRVKKNNSCRLKKKFIFINLTLPENAAAIQRK